MVIIPKYPSWPFLRSILISKDIHRKPSPPSLVGSNPRQSWLLNPDLWLIDSSNGFTHSHTQIPPSYRFSICVNKILCYTSQQGQKEDKTACNRAPRRCATSQTTTRLHWRCAFLFSSSNKCQGRLSNNCCNPGDGERERRGRKLFGVTHQTFGPFWSRHLCLTACYWELILPLSPSHSLSHTHTGQSVRSEGTQNKTPLCICQEAPLSLLFSGHLRIGGGAGLQQSHHTRAADSNLKKTAKNQTTDDDQELVKRSGELASNASIASTAQAEQIPKFCTGVSNLYEEVNKVSHNYLCLDLIFQITM